MLSLLLALAVCGRALVDIPHRARGGSVFVEHSQLGKVIERDGSLFGFGGAVTAAKTITQPLDHDNADQGEFEQRYYEDVSAWGSASHPIFVYIGGEGPLNGLPNGYAAAMARQHNAALLALEARFYGESVPLEADKSTKNFSVQALQFLTVENHLQDLDVFIRKWKSDHKATGVVGVIGGSYPGGLAAWFRVAYPNTAAWAWSSSGVVNALVDFPEFDEHISNALESYNSTCRDLVHQTMEAFSTAFHAGGSEATKAAGYFGGAPSKADDALYMVNDAAAMMVQYGAKTRLCAGMRAGSADELMQRFGAMTVEFWGADFGKDCFYDTDCLKNDPSRWQPTSRSWRWQKCAQVGWLQRAPNKDPIRATSLTLEVLQRQCDDVFGSAVPAAPAADALNAKFGGATPKTDHVVATEFSDDPWLEVGVMHSISKDYPRLLANCTDCGHCNDLHMPSDADPHPLTALRQAEAAYIQQWIKDASLDV